MLFLIIIIIVCLFLSIAYNLVEVVRFASKKITVNLTSVYKNMVLDSQNGFG